MMTELTAPEEDEFLSEFRIGASFFVGARDMAEARALLEQTLSAEDSDGTPFVTRSGRVFSNDQSWGVVDWAQTPSMPSRAAQVQGDYPGLVNDAATIETLRAILQAADRPVTLSELVPEATLNRVRDILAELNPEVMVDDPDGQPRLVYQGPADEAATYLSEGAYRAFGMDDREYALIVAPSELTPAGRVSQVIPKGRHDAHTLDEISSLMQRHDRSQSLTQLVRDVSRRLETTRRSGIPSWMPLEGDPRQEPTPAKVQVGVITWSDLPDAEPTVLVDTNPVRLARNMARTVYEGIDEDPAYAGAEEFLSAHKRPDEWLEPRDVDMWLTALQETTPHPRVSFNSLEVTGRRPSQSPEAYARENATAQAATRAEASASAETVREVLDERARGIDPAPETEAASSRRVFRHDIEGH